MLKIVSALLLAAMFIGCSESATTEATTEAPVAEEAAAPVAEEAAAPAEEAAAPAAEAAPAK